MLKQVSRLFSIINAFAAAFVWLIGLFDPKLFATTSFTPPSSNTARTLDPAIMPLPLAAGFNITRAPSQLTTTSWGIVVPSSWKEKTFFRAASLPFLIASETSFALANPSPIFPFPSPTKISAEKLNFIQPVVTFEHLLI